MKLEIPEIPRDRPLITYDLTLDLVEDDEEYWLSGDCEEFRYGGALVQPVSYPAYSRNMRLVIDADFYWNFTLGNTEHRLDECETKAFGLPKLETRRNGDKLEVWAVDWE